MPPPAGRHRRTRPPPSPRSAPQASRPAITLLVYLPRSCSQPFRLQRLTNSCLMAPVHDHWDAERARLRPVTGLRYVHPPDRRWPPRASCGVHLHRHLRPGLAGQRDLPVNPRGPAARVALRHLPHADQRVRPAAQHQLLQVPDLGQVPVPSRLEDPAPQPPYPLPRSLASPPVPRRHRRTPRSGPRVRSPKCPTCPSAPTSASAFTSKAHLPTSAPSRAPSTRLGIRPVGPSTSGGGSGLAVDGFLLPFGCRHSLLGHPVPPGVPPPLRSAYRSSRAHPRTFHGPIAGFPRSACVRPGPGRALSLPRGRRCSQAIGSSVAAACRLSTTGPYHPGTASQPGMLILRGIIESSLVVAPPALPLACGRHGWSGGPWTFP